MGAYEKAVKFSSLLEERDYWLGVDLEDFTGEVDVEALAKKTDELLSQLDPFDLPSYIAVAHGGKDIFVTIWRERGPEYRGTPRPVGWFVFDKSPR